MLRYWNKCDTFGKNAHSLHSDFPKTMDNCHNTTSTFKSEKQLAAVNFIDKEWSRRSVSCLLHKSSVACCLSDTWAYLFIYKTRKVVTERNSPGYDWRWNYYWYVMLSMLVSWPSFTSSEFDGLSKLFIILSRERSFCTGADIILFTSSFSMM